MVPRSSTARWLTGVMLLAWTLTSSTPDAAAQSGTSPYTPFQHRAWYIYLISQYADWPTNTFADAAAPFTLGILGEDPFRKEIDVIQAKPLKNRKLVIKYAAKLDELGPCQALYICDSERERLPQILKALTGTTTLTFGELEGFLEAGGMVKFWVERKTEREGYLRFQINQAAVQSAGLRVHSRVLNLAKPEVKSD